MFGFSKLSSLIHIQLPLALRFSVTGIKASAVINVGTATPRVAIGAGDYGQTILTGIRLYDLPHFGRRNSCLGHGNPEPIFFKLLVKRTSEQCKTDRRNQSFC